MGGAMTAVAAISEKRVDLLDVFIERASARALLWAESEIDTIQSAVDRLQEFAERSGLVGEIGQDAVQEIPSDAFASYRSREDSADYEAPAVAPIPTKRPTPRTTIEAIMWCVRERGLNALREPENIERLSRCDTGAKAEINQRIEAYWQRERSYEAATRLLRRGVA
jgi:hypothetical protein